MAGALLPVDEALARILAAARLTDAERIPLSTARGRTLALPLAATRTQPPFATSAMDGYAVRGTDVARPGARLRLIGQTAAGHGFSGAVGSGEAVRIFTGAPLPDGADTILIQENASADGDEITALQAEPRGRFVRAAGLDFREKQVLLPEGTRLGARELGLAAAMNHATLPVRKKPRVAILATGDELVEPGEMPGRDQIIASNHFAVAAAVESAGGQALLLPIATDDFASLERSILSARNAGADVLLTIGGASVGDHDLVQSALAREGMDLGFWRIAMRPGKPLMFGQLGQMLLIGLPGNPVSSIVCSLIFVQPLIRAMLGDPGAGDDPSRPAILGAEMKENDERLDYVRARIIGERDGLPVVVPHSRQDSSMLSTLAASDCLLIRERHAPAAAEGATCRIVLLSRLD
ncbi:MAG: molybdopterin molybdotransferase MoeA [Proteobacteria bacterium]|nr:molybdopterin molybdotransferase MoeA [Pseudomonadota bacterium]